MAFTKIVSPGIDTTGSYTVQELNTVGVVTAATVQIGAATTVHTTGIDLGSGNITSHNINSTGSITAASFVGPVTGNITGDITATSGTFSGNVSIGGTLTYEDVTNIDAVGVVTARSGIHVTGGSVGIGTDNPVRKLDVDGTSRFTDYIYGNSTTNKIYVNDDLALSATKKLYFDTGSNTYIHEESADNLAVVTGGTEKLRITSAGDMRLGTGTPTSFGPTLQVAGTDPALLLQDTATIADYFGVNVTSGIAQLWYDDAASFTINTATAIAGSGLAERLRIKSDGKIGINNSDPQYLLSLKSNDTGTTKRVDIHMTNDTTGHAGGDGVQIGYQDTYGAYIWNFENTPVYFGTNNVERLRITSAGLVNIGTNNQSGGDSSSKLRVGTASGSDVGVVVFGNADTTTPALVITNWDGAQTQNKSIIHFDNSGWGSFQIGCAAGEDAFGIFDDGTERLRIDSTGDVRFAGTNLTNNTNKSVNLTVPSYNTSEEDVNLIQVENESGSNQITFGGGTSALNAATTLRFLTASAVNTTTGTERLRIHSTGATTMHVNSASHETFRFTTQGLNEAKLIMKDASSNIDVVLNTAGDTFFQGGNVAIGHNSPSQLLHLKGSSHSLRIERSNATGPGYLDILISHANSSRYGSIYFNADTSGGTSDFIFRHGASSSYAEKFRIDKTGNYVAFGGAKVYSYGGTANTNASFSIDIVFPINYGGGLVLANGWHYGNSGYGASRMSIVSVGPHGLIDKNIENSTTGAGGSWSFSKVDNYTMRISKTGGSYNSGMGWNVAFIGN